MKGNLEKGGINPGAVGKAGSEKGAVEGPKRLPMGKPSSGVLGRSGVSNSHISR